MPTTSGSDDDDNASGQQLQMTGIRRPGEHDVLNGRGGLANNFPGNILYRDTVDSRKAEYVQSQRAQKTALSWSLVRWWRGLDPPGRFLQQDEAGLWHDIGDKKARRKTSQLLREDAKVVREQVGATSTDHDSEGGTDTSEDTDASPKKRKVVKSPQPETTGLRKESSSSNLLRTKGHAQQASLAKHHPVRKNSAAKIARKKSLPNKPTTNGSLKGATQRTSVAGKQHTETAKLNAPPEKGGVAAPVVQDDSEMPALGGGVTFGVNLPPLGVEPVAVGGQREISWGPIDQYLLDVDMSDWALGEIGGSDARGASGVPIEPLLDCMTDSTDQEVAASSHPEDGMDMDNDGSGRQVKCRAGPHAQ